MEKLRRDQLVTLEDLEGLKLELLDSMEKLIRDRFRDHTIKRWMKSAEVRKLLGFSPGKLQSIRQSGILPYTQIGGNIYYDPEDQAKLFNDRKRFKDDFQPLKASESQFRQNYGTFRSTS